MKLLSKTILMVLMISILCTTIPAANAQTVVINNTSSDYINLTETPNENNISKYDIIDLTYVRINIPTLDLTALNQNHVSNLETENNEELQAEDVMKEEPEKVSPTHKHPNKKSPIVVCLQYETDIQKTEIHNGKHNIWEDLDVVIDENLEMQRKFREKIVAITKNCLGVPYVWGGTNMKGFDCSGLVYYVFKVAGYKMPRGMSSQYAAGKPIKQNELQAGDLVFFQNTSGVGMSHVGIYIGDGQFIHAPRTGKTVSYANLNSDYWQEHYYGACRIVTT